MADNSVNKDGKAFNGNYGAVAVAFGTVAIVGVLFIANLFGLL